MTGTGITTLLLIVTNVLFSYKGFKDRAFFDRYKFQVERITIYKDYRGLVTSGFLHANWMHLIMNMFALYFFAGAVEGYLGPFKFLLIYFASEVGGNLFSLLVHKNDGGYSSIGASGAVMGVMFASIALFPGIDINLFIISIPGWLFGLAYVLYAIYGVRSGMNNVGHEAHLAGALMGMAVAILFEPSVLFTNTFAIAIIALPGIFFIYMIMTRPGFLLIDNYFFKERHSQLTVDQRYNMSKADKQKEIDRILDKIGKSGMNSLTRKEKQTLDEYSETIR